MDEKKRIVSFLDLDVYRSTYDASVTVLTKIIPNLPDDAMEESNETIVSLSHAKDVYKVEVELCTKLIDKYDKAARQLYNVGLAWSSFK